MSPRLVAGIDSSTQSCKVVVCDADTGAVRRSGTAPHVPGTTADPDMWWDALTAAIASAGGFDDVSAAAVGAQQHGMVALDECGRVVRDALLWNDTRSAAAAEDLICELPGGAPAWAAAVGSVPVASFTVTKLRWLAEHEPQNAARTAAVALPHDWLTWRLAGASGLDSLVTDRGDASGTGYWSPTSGEYRPDLLRLAFGRELAVPQVLAPSAPGGHGTTGAVLGAGTGDNAASALGLGAEPGDVIVSVGTSGVVAAVSPTPSADPTGEVTGFADATGRFLPLTATLNGAPVLVRVAELLGIDLDELARLARSAPPGADGVVLVPYFDGERTPNRPDATAAVHGLRSDNSTPANLARAAFEGLVCGLADGVDALRAIGVEVSRVLLVGGGARSAALPEIAAGLLDVAVVVPAPAEYVALGAARQAAWVLDGGGEPPPWPLAGTTTVHAASGPGTASDVRARYAKCVT